MTAVDVAAYLSTLVASYVVGWKVGSVVHFIKKLGTSA